MRKQLTGTALVASLFVGTLSGCGAEGVKQEGQVAGFAQGVDGQIFEDQWVHHKNEDEIPSGTIRDTEEHEEFAGCREVGDGLLSWNTDDPECWGTWCVSSESTHCEAEYDTKYSFDRLEEVKVQDCPAPMRPVEYRSDDEVFIDQPCIDGAQPHQRVVRISRFLIYVSTPNPNYDSSDSKKANEPRFLQDSQEVTQEEWRTIDRSTEVNVTVRGAEITNISFGE